MSRIGRKLACVSHQVVDDFDMLSTVRAGGSSDVHLAPLTWTERDDITTLCGRDIRGPPTRSFRRNGCLRCAGSALGMGITAVRAWPRVAAYPYRLLQSRNR